MGSVRSLIGSRMACGVVAALLLGIGPGVATAQSVRGHGKVDLFGVGTLPDLIAVDAWLDDDGVAHGAMTWVGGVPQVQPGGPADPWLIDVNAIYFDGNTAVVFGVVTHSVFPEDIGSVVIFAFTDNSGTGQPDEIDGVPIEAGNFTVDD